MPRTKARSALLIIDMVNRLDFPEGKRLLAHHRVSGFKSDRCGERPVTIGVSGHRARQLSDYRFGAMRTRA